MSMSRITATLAAFITLCTCATGAYAQRELHQVPPVINSDGYNPDYLQPFVEPLSFNPDFQLFAPADFDIYGGTPYANTGWFATYDKVRIYVTRPDQVLQVTEGQVNSLPHQDRTHLLANTEGDFTWGNRFDLGYMTEEDHGWLFSFWHIDGPNAVNVVEQERINVYEDEDVINSAEDTIILRGGGNGGLQPGDSLQTGVPEIDRNDPITGQRDYRLQDTQNVGDLSSMEFNKTLRLRPRHYGSIVEPFCGVRYLKFQDFTQFDTYGRYDNDTGILVVPPVVQDVALVDNATIEQLNSLQTAWTNNMVGGQLGLRWYKQKNRWNLSGEVRAFAFQNFQTYRRTDYVETTYYDGTGIGDDVLYVFKQEDTNHRNDSEFVYGTEVRAEAAYAVSRDVSLRAGVAFLEFGRGVARGNDFTHNSQDITMIGYTFGVMVNR